MPRPTKPKPTPPDPEGMNEQRAARAFAALLEYEHITNTDREDVVADLLCDLKHWCDRNGFNFNEELHRAKGMYNEETRRTSENEIVFTRPASVTTPVPFRDIPVQPTPQNNVPF